MPPTELDNLLAEHKVCIDAALDERLPLAELEPCTVHEAMRYATLDGGKRLRPTLALLVCEMAGAPADRIIDAACGIELLHTASLILDDLPSMDNAATRRGRPCVHVHFDEATALLAAMGLVALSFDLITRSGRGEPVVQAVRELSRVMGTKGIVHGQHTDLVLSGAPATVEELEALCNHKAAALFLAAIRIPALILDIPAEETHALIEFGRCLGLSFQITDDLLDAAKSSEDVGKTTYATHLGVDDARKRVKQLIQMAVAALEPLGGRAAPLRTLAEYVESRAV